MNNKKMGQVWQTAPKEQEAEFKCPCEGGNSECSHCQGTGLTRYQVGVRSQRTLSLNSSIEATPFFTKRERLIGQQVNNQLRHLRVKFLSEKNERPTLFITYLRKLVLELRCNEILSKYRGFFFYDDVKQLPKLLGDLTKTHEKERIIADATKSAIRIYRTALALKLAKKKKPVKVEEQFENASPHISESSFFKCPHCQRKIFDQTQHNQLFHPSDRSFPIRRKETSQKSKLRGASSYVQAPTAVPAVIKKSKKNLNQTKKITAARSKVNVVISAPPENQNQAKADIVERSMDALRNWGGTFRDTNGTFGSYPLHDNMDDESNAY